MTLILAMLVPAFAGDINGRVLDPRGLGVSGATVVAYDQRFSYAIDTTAADGSFDFVGLPVNPYRIRVLPPRDANLVERYLPGSLDICDGEIFTIKRQNVVEVGDAVLVSGGQISGRVLDAAGQPVEGALISSHASMTIDATQPRYGNSDAEGRWTLSGLSVDGGTDYFVEIEMEGWPDQFLPGVYDTERAIAFSFAIDEVDFVDSGTHLLLDGIAVSGIVSGSFAPASTGNVFVYASSQLVEAPIEADGTWATVGLPPGEILVWAEVEGLATTYYPDADRPAERIVAFEEGEFVTDVALVLPAEARIVGRIVSDSDLSEITIIAYNDDRTVAVSSRVDAAGNFVITGLHGGDYTLQVFGEAAGLISGDLLDEEGLPALFSVGVADTLDLGEFDVPVGAVIKGTAVDVYTGKKIYGAFIYAESEETGNINLSVTDNRGRYDISGLRKGAYRLWADYQAYCDADLDWAPSYWPNVVNPVLNGSVQVQTGETVKWDPNMPPDADHDQMDDRWEEDHGLDRRRDDSAEDPDGDGFTNLEEYQLGTDPLDGRNGHGCGCAGGSNALWLFLAMPLFRRRHL